MPKPHRPQHLPQPSPSGRPAPKPPVRPGPGDRLHIQAPTAPGSPARALQRWPGAMWPPARRTVGTWRTELFALSTALGGEAAASTSRRSRTCLQPDAKADPAHRTQRAGQSVDFVSPKTLASGPKANASGQKLAPAERGVEFDMQSLGSHKTRPQACSGDARRKSSARMTLRTPHVRLKSWLEPRPAIRFTARCC